MLISKNVEPIWSRLIVQGGRDRFAARLGDLAVETGTSIYAWALLTNHAHILLRGGSGGLPKFMRRFLTGYAVTYNLRHQRHGHLFQNRCKWIVCDEDTYFQELVRYIHLNPLRAKLVDDLAGLERYAWCGHGVVTGKIKNEWQDRELMLRGFGRTVRTAIKNYRKFDRRWRFDGAPARVGGTRPDPFPRWLVRGGIDAPAGRPGDERWTNTGGWRFRATHS